MTTEYSVVAGRLSSHFNISLGNHMPPEGAHAAPAAGLAQRRSAWLVAVATLVIASLSFGAVTSIPILLKPIAAEWSVSTATIAFVHTSAMLGAAFGSVLLGRATDRFGFLPIAFFAAAATGLGLALAASTTNLIVLHIAFGLLVGGLGQGAFFSPLAAAVSHRFDRHRGLAIAIATSGQSIGGLVVPPVLRYLEQETGWRTTLLGYAGLSSALIVLCALAFRGDIPAALAAANTGTRAQRISRRTYVLFALCMGLFNLATFIVIGHVIAYGEESGLAPVDAAQTLSALLGATLISRLSMNWLCTRLGHYVALAGVSAIHLAGLWLLAGAATHSAIIAAVVVIGVGFGGYMPGYAIVVREIFPAAEAGRRIGEIYFLAFVAAGAGSLVGGLLRDLTGSYGMPFVVAAMSASTGGVLLAILGRSMTVLLPRRNPA